MDGIWVEQASYKLFLGNPNTLILSSFKLDVSA